MAGHKNCWATAVVDEIGAIEAAVLAKSLVRVVSLADTIVFVPLDISDSIGKMLANFYDVVFPVDLPKDDVHKGLSKKDRLLISSWVLGMYAKCIMVDSKTVVLKNCDELFNLDCDISVVKNQDQQHFEANVCVIKPCYKINQKLLEMASSENFFNLSELLNNYFVEFKPCIVDLIPIYNFNGQNLALNSCLDDVKIFTFSNRNLLKENGLITSGDAQTQVFKNTWMSFFKEMEDKIPPNIVNNDSSMKEPVECLNEELFNKRSYYRDSIAIVGHSCRLPGSNSIDEFWNLLKTGGSGIIPCPQERLTDEERYDQKYIDSRAGFLKCRIDEFDAKFFGISPREAAIMDPQQRLLVEVAWEALENAAINPHSLKGSNTAVFSGIWCHDYEHLLIENTTYFNFHHIVLGNAFSSSSARISYILGLNGPNIITESACSSSFGALHLACESLRRGETNLGLVCGANIMISQVSLLEIPILAKDGQCKTFDEKADGFGRAEGIAVLVVKRLTDAIRDGDRIMGLVRGSAMSQEGTTSSFGTPSKLCQEIAIKDAIKNAGVKPGEVDYVDAHGTGTPVGDPIEFAAISAAYTGERDKPLIIGSVKTNTGHTESVAGLTSVIKVMLSMKHEMIPPHINFDTLNPNINLDTIPATIPVKSVKWQRNPDRTRIAGVSSFGISGTNVHVILEEPPCDSYFQTRNLKLIDSDRTHHILTLSAKTENALKDLSAKYIEYFQENLTENIADIAFTANTGKAHHQKYRQFVVGENINELKFGLEKNEHSTTTILNAKPKFGFLFTGQGSQYFGMGKELYSSNLVFREAFSKCANIIENNMGISINNALWNESYKNLVDETIYSQLSIFSIGYSLLKLWESLGVKPDFVLGHSVGEFAAAVAANILSLEDAIKLLSERSRLIQKLPGGGMLAVRCSEEKVSNLIEEFLLEYKSGNTKWLDIAVVNSADSVVVAGTNNEINSFKEWCTTKGVKATTLAASHAFHSRAIEGVMKEFGEFADSITYKSPNCAYISGTTGETLSGLMDGEYWQKHAREPVNFLKGMQTLSESGCNIFIEIGAHPVLLALGMSNVANSENQLWLPSIRRNENNWVTLLQSVGSLYINNFDICWKSLDKSIARKKLELPSYPFQRQIYWTEITKENPGKPLHPLLGRKVPLANIKDIVYENTIDTKTLSYLLDHQIAHIPVFPGAGYLETFLAVGRDNLKCNMNEVIKVEDFVVESPFEIVEHKKNKIQVVVSPVSDNDSEEKKKLQAKFYSYANLNGYNDEKGWKLHSRANISLSDSSDAVYKHKTEILNPEDVKLRCPLEKDSVDYYKPAAEIGIHFGETFQCIEKNWTRKGEALAKIPLPSKAGSLKDYIYHPIILDAMIQSFGITVGDQNSSLYLPIGMEKFLVLSNDSISSSKLFYAHAKWDHGKTWANVELYNEENKILAFMQGVRLLQTSASSFLNVINGEKNVLPGMYQEMWKIKDVGPQQFRMNIAKIETPEQILDKLHLTMDESHVVGLNSEIEALENELMSLTIVSGLQQAGWNPQVGEIFDSQVVMQNLLFSYSYSNYVDRIFEILCEDGYTLEIQDGSCKEWKLIKEFPILKEINRKQKELLEIIYSKRQDEKDMITELAINSSANLMKVLQGKETAVSALFGAEGYDPIDLYTNRLESVLANSRLGKFLEMMLGNKLGEGGDDEGSIVRVIEVGAGTGATTKEILETFQRLGIQFRYTFTDISPFFLETAKKTFSDIPGIEYRILDIEKDPGSQGFCPHHYDIVVAANVLHATENLRNSLYNVRRLLVPHGSVILQEKLRPFRTFDILFGLLDGYWRFSDYDLRKSHPTASKDIWDQVFLENNFSVSQLISREDELTSVLVTTANSVEMITSKFTSKSVSLKKSAWLVFGDEGKIENSLVQKLALEKFVVKITSHNKMQNENTVDLENTISINLSDPDLIQGNLHDLSEQYDITEIVLLYSLNDDKMTNPDDIYLRTLNICKFVSASVKSQIKFCVVSRGAQFVPNQELVFPTMAPVLGMVKSLANEIPSIQLKVVDLDPDEVYESLEVEELFYELFSLDESSICYRNRKRFANRMVTLPKPTAPLSLPQCQYKIEIPSSKKIDDVYFKSYAEAKLKSDEAEVELKATSLNFRDVFVILKPETFKSAFNAVGTEFSGVISRIGSSVSKFKVGDEVFGFYNTSCAGSHVVLHANMLMAKPKSYSFAEASTIPFVFFTAYRCLVDVANLKKDETVLIHVASGGVGLIAIQIAQSIGAKIIATAGSHRKRTYLNSIGIEHIFHSRDTTFEKDILKVTNGKGVDVVLNSLTGPGFVESSLKCCAPGARFVEMAKLNIWKPENVVKLRHDVEYTIVNMEDIERNGIIHLMSRLEESIQNGIVAPLPYSRFEITHIRDALNYLLKAEHIGKIVVVMPEAKQANGAKFNNELIFNSNSTYLITGGLGGIGLEVAKWMANSGARNIILVGRSPPNEKALQALTNLNNIGCKVLPVQIDIGNMKQCKELFEMILNPQSRLPPLKGVLHSAGVLSDSVFTNQTWEKYQVVFNAKVKGGWNLHELTKNMNLEYFVLFSSMAAVMFPVGQSNHSAANLFLDSLAHYRHSIGLPSQTINWGVWGDVGVATDTAYVKEGAFGVKPFSSKQGIAALKFAMIRPNLTQLGVLQLDVATFKQTAYFNSGIMSLLEDEDENENQAQNNVLSEKFMSEISSLSIEERTGCFKTRLETIVRKTLKLSESDVIDEHQQFQELGLDSLMSLEMKNKLQSMVGKSLTLNSTSLLDYPTIGSLSKYLAEATMTVVTGDSDAIQKESADLSVSYELVKTDSVLPIDITAAEGNKIVRKSEIINVLVTGSTGQMGGYILKDLLIKNHLNIYCLIRGRNVSQAKEKLAAALKKYQLTESVDISKISFILGNIAEDRFGLSTEEYQTLCAKMDCVFHLAAKVNHTEVYQATKSNVDIRHVNVMGTVNVLRFCSNIKTKQLMFASTYPAINRLTPDGCASDEFPDSDNFGDGITEGYFLSKFVCEKLLREVINRGMPCTCIRYPIIVGDSVTGHFTVDTNLFLNMSLISSRLGIFPDLKGGLNCLPVDIASRLTMELVFNDQAEIGAYNLLHTVPLYSKDVVEAAMNAGYKMAIVSEDEYFEAFEKESKSNNFLQVFGEQYGDLSSLLNLSDTLTLSMKNEKNIYRFSEKFLKAIPDVQQKIPKMQMLLALYFDYANRSGISKKYGLVK